MARPSVWGPLLAQLALPENKGKWKILRTYDSYNAAIKAMEYVRTRYVKDGIRFKVAEKDGRHVLAGLIE